MTTAGSPSPTDTPARVARLGITSSRAPLRRGGGFLERSGAQDARDLLAVEGLALEQRPGERVELFDVVLEDLTRAARALEHDTLDLRVDHQGRVLAVVLLARHLAAEEDVLLVLAEGERTELVGHAPLAHHLARHLGRLLEVVAGARRLLMEDDLLGGAPAQEDRDSVGQVLLRVVVLVVERQLLREPERTAAWDDRDLVHRVRARQEIGHERVPCLVEGDRPLLGGGDDHRAPLDAHQDLVLGVLEVDHLDELLVLARREQRRLVDEIREVGAGEAGRPPGEDFQVDVRRQRDAPGVNAQDLLTALDVRPRDDHLAIEAPRAEQRRVEHVGPVRRGDEDDALVRLEAVHLDEELVEMDGFETNEGVILIAATNRPDVLDPALLRPGRFDRQVVVPRPDVKGREKILKVHMRKVPLASDVDPKIIARGTPGFSGADLANLVNEAALMAARRGKRSVAMGEFEHAKDKVMMGAERRSMVMTEDEKRLTAYHEAGHALCMLYAEAHEPLHKVTIIPRGRALGVTMFLPERDKYSQSKLEIKAMMASLFGGRVAEELIFGEDKVTTGAADDIRRATGIARRMVTEFGFSDKLGPLRYADNEEEVFLGHSVTQRKNMSDATAKLIDEEIRRIVEEGEHAARKILTGHLDELNALAKGLLEYETLSADEIRRLIKDERIVRDTSTPAPSEEPRPGRRSSVPPSGRPTGLEPEPQPGN